MVSRCVAKEVQRNAKWGLLCEKREWVGREKKVSKVDKGERTRWEKRVGKVESESW